MPQSRGPIQIERLFTTEEMGLRSDASLEHVLKVFLNIGEAQASRWIEMPRGVLLLQSAPDNPAAGAIYLYDRERQVFYLVTFKEGRDDSVTVPDFEQLISEYDLLSWTANPDLMVTCFTKPGRA